MSDKSSIEWTESTWNPVAGCTVVSPGCSNCYAMRMARRLEAMGQRKYEGTTRQSGGRTKWSGVVRLDEESLSIPEKWKGGRLVFGNSMSDLFHAIIPLRFIQRVFAVMRRTPQHTYQVLTKRSARLETLSPRLGWAENIWMGVSVESTDYLHRVDQLRRSGANTKFLSLEPLLGPLERMNLKEIDWVIAGGESGPGARPMSAQWVRSIRDQCIASSVAFHFKQWGGVRKARNGRTLDGRTWDEFPGRRGLHNPSLSGVSAIRR